MGSTPDRYRDKAVQSHAQQMQPLDLIARRFVLLAVLWALAELPLELVTSDSIVGAAALLFAMVVFLAIAKLTLKGVIWARALFALICGLSVLAIAPALPTEFQRFPTGFVFSLGELLTKGLALLAVYGKLAGIVRVAANPAEKMVPKTSDQMNAADFE
jgi:hypothetical protein